jgi:hypothetical protein
MRRWAHRAGRASLHVYSGIQQMAAGSANSDRHPNPLDEVDMRQKREAPDREPKLIYFMLAFVELLPGG